MRDLVFAHWQSAGCEAFEDTLKMTSLVDFYIPYFPLERRHVAELARRQLAGGDLRRARTAVAVAWGVVVVAFLVDKVGARFGTGRGCGRGPCSRMHWHTVLSK